MSRCNPASYLQSSVLKAELLDIGCNLAAREESVGERTHPFQGSCLHRDQEETGLKVQVIRHQRNLV